MLRATCAGTKAISPASSSVYYGQSWIPNSTRLKPLLHMHCVDVNTNVWIFWNYSVNWNSRSSRWGRKWQLCCLVGWWRTTNIRAWISRPIITQQGAPGGVEPSHTHHTLQHSRLSLVGDKRSHGVRVHRVREVGRMEATSCLIWKHLRAVFFSKLLPRFYHSFFSSPGLSQLCLSLRLCPVFLRYWDKSLIFPPSIPWCKPSFSFRLDPSRLQHFLQHQSAACV